MKLGLGILLAPPEGTAGEKESFRGWLERLEAKLEAAKEAGAAFAELPLYVLAGLTDEQFGEAAALIRKAGLPIDSVVALFPGDLRVVGPEVDEERVAGYLERAFERAAELGTETVVFGSGRARSFPDGWSKEQAMGQLEALLQRCDALAQRHGLLVALEPLNRRETNLIRFLEDAVELAARLYLPNLRVLADAYHMDVMREDFEMVEEACEMGLLAHAHVATATRGYPLPEEERQEESGRKFVPAFVSSLVRAGYEGRLSIEALEEGADHSPDVQRRSLAYLRSLAAGE
ncbi:sugar phosphate isomerase/epimerase [Paenibacillus sp. J31TS4]|uniref:sugar phosphate isomerase/epimerase family protein n=1 Tax=Paenibacillus sp. J31TS4 TaxID=2807195 RepID=UPI001BD19462|nr:sugar phosphate isomerase/epimerase family protein [Paenibacillus sp. J31TS4]